MKVIDLRKRFGVINGGKSTVKGASDGANGNMSREEVLLLRLADKIDTMVLDNILEHNLSAPEIAALIAHRLGRLILAMPSLPGCSELDTQKLKDYVHEIIDREAGDPEQNLKKSS
jgi:hypothetical protein